MDINIADIKIERKESTTRRTRKLMGDITRLAESIKAHGLLHPIVVNKLKDDPLYDYVLIAGERRIRACVLNGSGTITCNLIDDLSEADRKVCELEENIVRKNLDWLEECNALYQLNEIKKKKYGKAQPGSTEGWAIADTAEVVGIARAQVTDDIKLAKDLLANPQLIKKVIKFPKTAAKKIVRMEMEAIALRKQVERKEVTIASNLILGDACTLIDNLKDGSVHLLLTDPPFGIQDIIDMGSHGTMTYNKITSSNVSDEDVMRSVYKVLLPKVFKKLAKGSHIYIFHAMGWYCELIHMLRKTGFVVDDLPLIWHKRRPTTLPKDMHYTSSYEAILFGYKPPNTRPLKRPVPNVFPISAVAPQKRVHPLQKPFDLLKVFVENSSNVGETVLDCFAGSASTLIAAEKLKRSGIGFEIDEKNYLRAQQFMRKEKQNEND